MIFSIKSSKPDGMKSRIRAIVSPLAVPAMAVREAEGGTNVKCHNIEPARSLERPRNSERWSKLHRLYSLVFDTSHNHQSATLRRVASRKNGFMLLILLMLLSVTRASSSRASYSASSSSGSGSASSSESDASSPSRSKRYEKLLNSTVVSGGKKMKFHTSAKCYANTERMLKDIRKNGPDDPEAYALIFSGPPKLHPRESLVEDGEPTHFTFWGDDTWNYHVVALVLTTKGWRWSCSYIEREDLNSKEQEYMEDLACFKIDYLKKSFLTGRDEASFWKQYKEQEEKLIGLVGLEDYRMYKEQPNKYRKDKPSTHYYLIPMRYYQIPKKKDDGNYEICDYILEGIYEKESGPHHVKMIKSYKKFTNWLEETEEHHSGRRVPVEKVVRTFEKNLRREKKERRTRRKNKKAMDKYWSRVWKTVGILVGGGTLTILYSWYNNEDFWEETWYSVKSFFGYGDDSSYESDYGNYERR